MLINLSQGLRDMLEALRWVRANIASFGGDPDRVTLMGDTAGGIASQLLSLSPQMKGEGLFRGVITHSLSGLSLSMSMAARDPDKQSSRFVQVIGCVDGTQPKELVKCLQVC